MSKPYLEKFEIERAKMCLSNIEDKLKSVSTEIQNEKPYKYYLLEKLNSILNDTNVLIYMCEDEEEGDS